MPEDVRVVGSWTGDLGVAQLVKAQPRTKAEQATLVSWFLEFGVDGHEESSDKYLLSLIHLRDISGVPSAHKASAESMYELMVLRLDPSANPKADDPESWRFVRRPMVTIQLGGKPDDDEARDIAEFAAIALINGWLPLDPESGPEWGRQLWDFIERFHKDYREGSINIYRDGTINIITGL